MIKVFSFFLLFAIPCKADSLRLKKNLAKNPIAQSISHDPDLKFKEIVLAKAIEETGFFKSNVFKTKHNLFGIKGRNGSYMQFKSWRDCLDFYTRLQKKYIAKYHIKNSNQYLLITSKFWASNKKWRRNVQNISKSICY